MIVCIVSSCDDYYRYMDSFERFGTNNFSVALDVEDWRNIRLKLLLVRFRFFFVKFVFDGRF